MTTTEAQSTHITRMLNQLSRRDYLAATGPLLIAAVFAFVLYGIQVPVNFLVIYGVGLVYWPLFEVTGLLVEQGLVAAFVSRKPEQWERFRNGFFPLLMLAVAIGLFIFGQWFWLIIFGQCLRLVFDPPDESMQKSGCLQGTVTAVLLFIIFVMAVFGLPEYLSTLFKFPNVGGGLQYLPGMLILGIGYYLFMWVANILHRPILQIITLDDDEDEGYEK